MKIRKRFILGPAIALAAVAAVIGGVAAAHPPADSGETARGRLLERAASQLGIDPATLTDAMKQARQELMAEQLDARLAQAVEDGTITQEEADAIKAWVESRPAALDKLGRGGSGLPGMYGRGNHGSRGFGRHGFGGYIVPDNGQSPQAGATGTGVNL